MLGNYLQQTTPADIIFQMQFFLGALRAKTINKFHHSNVHHNISDWFVYPNRFALDETTGNMYYTSTYNYIGIITPRQSYLDLEMRALVFEDVRAIALHPGKG